MNTQFRTAEQLEAAGYVRNTWGNFVPPSELQEVSELLQVLMTRYPRRFCHALYTEFNPHLIDETPGTAEAARVSMLVAKLSKDAEAYAERAYEWACAVETPEAAQEAIAAMDATVDAGFNSVAYGRLNVRIWLADRFLAKGDKATAARMVWEAFDYQAEHPHYEIEDSMFEHGALTLLHKIAKNVPIKWDDADFNTKHGMRAWAEEYKAWRSTAKKVGGA